MTMVANVAIFYALLAIGAAAGASPPPADARRVEDSVSLLQGRVGSNARAPEESRSSLGTPEEEVAAQILSDWGSGLRVEVVRAFEGGLTTGARGTGFAAKVKGKTLPRDWKDPKAPFVIKKVKGNTNMKGMRKELKVLNAVRLERAGFPKLVGYKEFDSSSYLAQTLAPGFPEAEIEDTASDWSMATRRRCVKEIVKTMRALHTSGWAHADHNRANMMIGEDGSATLLDFDQAVDIGKETDQNTFEMGVLADLQYIFAVAGRLGLKITEEPLEPDGEAGQARLDQLRDEVEEKKQELARIKETLAAEMDAQMRLAISFSASPEEKADKKAQVAELRRQVERCEESRNAILLMIQEIKEPCDAEWNKAWEWAVAASGKASQQKPITKYDEAIKENILSLEEALLELLDGRLPPPSVAAITGQYPERAAFVKKPSAGGKTSKKSKKSGGKKGAAAKH